MQLKTGEMNPTATVESFVMATTARLPDDLKDNLLEVYQKNVSEHGHARKDALGPLGHTPTELAFLGFIDLDKCFTRDASGGIDWEAIPFNGPTAEAFGVDSVQAFLASEEAQLYAFQERAEAIWSQISAAQARAGLEEPHVADDDVIYDGADLAHAALYAGTSSHIADAMASQRVAKMDDFARSMGFIGGREMMDGLNGNDGPGVRLN